MNNKKEVLELQIKLELIKLARDLLKLIKKNSKRGK